MSADSTIPADALADNVPRDCRLVGVSQNPLRVVIAEDEALIRLDLKEMLEEEGYSVVAEAADGEAAIEKVTRAHHMYVVVGIVIWVAFVKSGVITPLRS